MLREINVGGEAIVRRAGLYSRGDYRTSTTPLICVSGCLCCGVAYADEYRLAGLGWYADSAECG